MSANQTIRSTWINSTFNSGLPSEIGKAEDDVKEVIASSKESVVENAIAFGNTISDKTEIITNQVKQSGTVVRQRAQRIGSVTEHHIRRGYEKACDVGGDACGMVSGLWDGRLLKYSELPEWMKDNEFITAFHRPEFQSCYTCLASIFRIHAETGNIWTHLLGAIAFLAFTIYYLFLPSVNFVSPFEEKTVVICFFLSAFVCLAFSTVFHTFGCHSPNVCLFCGRLDYTGIAVLITGSFLPWVYYSFYCQPLTKYIYMALMFSFGVVCTVISMGKTFQSPAFRSYRAVLFVIFGLCGVIPCVHTVISKGVAHSFTDGQMHWLIIMGAMYITGAIFFMTRFPECKWPGKFNLILQSHQIFHVFVVAAALLQTYAIYNLQTTRLKLGDICTTDSSHEDIPSQGHSELL